MQVHLIPGPLPLQSKGEGGSSSVRRKHAKRVCMCVCGVCEKWGGTPILPPMVMDLLQRTIGQRMNPNTSREKCHC